MSIESLQKGGFTATLSPEQDAFDPRKEYDNVGTMVCWHRRYNLGDVQPKESPKEYFLALAKRNREHDDAYLEKLKGMTFAQLLEDLSDRYLILPLYLYDHSGITMNTTGFSCPWDSGQVGNIYISHKDIYEEWSPDFDLKYADQAERMASARRALQNEVATYDQYLTGDVWCYCIKDEDGEVIDSCGGIFGHDHAVEEMKRALDALVEAARKEDEYAKRLMAL